MSFEVQVSGTQTEGDNTLYKLKITDLANYESREIRVRYSKLLELHNALQNDNNSHYEVQILNDQFPQFPSKSYFRSFVNDQEQILKRQQQIGKYFTEILKRPPPSIRSLNEFLREGVDSVREQELNTQYSSKRECLSGFKVERILPSSKFGKSTLLITPNQQKVILKKFYVNLKDAEKVKSQYLRAHQSINDFTHICKVISIFQFKAKNGFIDSLLGIPRSAIPCKNILQKAFNNLQYETTKIFCLEQYEGVNLDEFIKQQNKYLSLDDFLSIAQKLLQAIMVIHKKQLGHQRILPSSIIIGNDSVKLTGFLEPNDRYKEKFMMQGHYIRTEKEYEIIYEPPEKHKSHLACYPYKIDAWQFGICILRLATFLSNKEISNLLKSPTLFREVCGKVSERYGESIKIMIEHSLIEDQQARTDIKSLYLLVMQANIQPLITQFIQLSAALQFRKYVTNISQTELKTFQMEMQKLTTNVIILKINLSDQEINDEELNFYFDYLSQYCQVINLNMNLTRSKFNIKSLVTNLEKLKSLQHLAIDLKHLNLELALFHEFLQNSKFESLILDIRESEIPVKISFNYPGIKRVRIYEDHHIINQC